MISTHLQTRRFSARRHRLAPAPARRTTNTLPGLLIQHFGNPFQTNARGSGTLGRDLARAVILAEPLAYLREVGRDMVRYISPSAGLDRPYSGPGEDAGDLTRRDTTVEQATVQTARAVGFDAGSVKPDGGVQFVAEFQPMLRVAGVLAALALLALAVCGVLCGRGFLRAAAVLLLGAAILQPLTAVRTLSWGYRYGVVGAVDLVAAATLGAYALGPLRSPWGARRRASVATISPT